MRHTFSEETDDNKTNRKELFQITKSARKKIKPLEGSKLRDGVV